MKCVYCKKITECYNVIHPKIKRIQRLYKNVIGMIPDDHQSLCYCEYCVTIVTNELLSEQNAITMYHKKIQIPPNLLSDLSNKHFSCICTEVPHISKRFHETMPNNIIRIEQIVNNNLLAKYDTHSPFEYLFHGSNNQNYDSILANGFKLEHAKSTGALGAGIYFAQDASYSNSFTVSLLTTKGTVKNMLCARVVLTPNLTRTGDRIYAVFSETQCYPEFIIYYEVEI